MCIATSVIVVNIPQLTTPDPRSIQAWKPSILFESNSYGSGISSGCGHRPVAVRLPQPEVVPLNLQAIHKC
jgi:hypothetical protein